MTDDYTVVDLGGEPIEVVDLGDGEITIVTPVVAGPRGPRGFPGTGGGNDWLSDQAPLETPDAILTTFTTAVPYTTGTLRVYLNGLRESHVSELTTTTFAFEDAPWAVDSIRLDFLPTP